MKMSKSRFIFLRLLIAALCGCAIAVVGIEVTWPTTSIYVRYDSYSTRKFIQVLAEGVEKFRKEKGRLPVSLSELVSESSDDIPEGVLKDAWGNPLHYEVHGNQYQIYSYGQDNKPGGIGLAYDLTNKQPRTPHVSPTLGQVLRHRLYAASLRGVVLSSLAVFLLTFFMIKPGDFYGEKLAGLIGKLGCTVIACGFVAAFMAIFDIPTGH